MPTRQLTPAELILVRDLAAAMRTKAAQIMAIKSAYTEDRYKSEIYDAARMFWKEGLPGQFTARMRSTIKFGLTSAFEQGAESVGVTKDEFEEADNILLAGIIDEEQSHIPDLLEFMDQLANDRNARLADADFRLDMWVGRYQDIFERAVINFGGKTRLMWHEGDTKDKCETCLRLDGIVAWATEWDQAKIKPRSQTLACHGYNCDCSLEQTDRRRSPHALATIMNIVESTHA